MRARNALYDLGVLRRHALALPAVCVGNLTTGGTGKTPAVAWIAEHYRRRGETVAIVRRGYKRGGGSGPSDETMLLEDRLGIDVIENPDRVAAAREAADRGATLVVLDDGFQHRRARRDLDVVLIDATDPFGGGHMLPWGMLREPLGGLRRAGVFLLTRADQADEAALDAIERSLRERAPGTPIARSVHAPRRLYRAAVSGAARAGDAGGFDPRPGGGSDGRGADGRESGGRGADGEGPGDAAPEEWLAGRAVRALSGIGRPDAFARTLADLGASVEEAAVFPDHHDYRADEVAALLARPGAPWITTEKDWVKIRAFFDNSLPLFVLGVDLAVVANEAGLIDALDRVETGPGRGA